MYLGSNGKVVVPDTSSLMQCFLFTHRILGMVEFIRPLACAARKDKQYTKCSACLRHKVIIKKLANDQRARHARMTLLSSGVGFRVYHLRKQYDDRTCYWRARGQSCDKHTNPAGTKTLAVVVDATDHSKFPYPRSDIFNAKDLAVHARQCLDMMGIVCRLRVSTH